VSRGLIMVGLTLAAVVLAAPTADARAPARPGVVTQGDLTERDFARMQRGGVRTLRVLVRWRAIEPEAGAFDWTRLDRLATEAGAHGVELLPFVYGSPEWIAEPESRPPLDSPATRDAWRSFLSRIVERYRAGGELASAGAAPIRRWQVWNEPNFDFYWSPAPDPLEYARLLRISARTIRAADPRARVITAGLAPVAAGTEWSAFLRRLYRVRGFRRSFDALALHPYAVRIEGLRARIAQAREIMGEHGDRRAPLALTEVGWSSGTDRAAPLVVGPRSQARNLERAFAVAAERRFRVSEIDWYAWQDTSAVEASCTFCEQAGLFDRDGRAKPAWRAFKRVTRRAR
jgi:polysaccharide biosynthesis protein PslG